MFSAGFDRRRGFPAPVLFLAAALVAAGGACGNGDEEELARHRERLNAGFAGPDSPLPAEERASFAGLEFYPYDPGLVFRVPLDRRRAGAPVTMLDTKSEERRYTVAGTAAFTVDGSAVQVTLYRDPEDPADAPLFLPFRDATSGGETYHGGRYLDVPATRESFLLIDFNRAYLPYCAYDVRWACPLVPGENVLAVGIRAGEKGRAAGPG